LKLETLFHQETPGNNSTQRIKTLKEAPKIPIKIAKTKYKIPISL